VSAPIIDGLVLWRGLLDSRSRTTLLVVAREARNPEGIVVPLRDFGSIAELHDFAFAPNSEIERLMLWRSPATEDGDPFVKLPGESDQACCARLAGALTVPPEEKLLPPARRAGFARTLMPVWVLFGLGAALLAMTFLGGRSSKPEGPPSPALSGDLPPAEALCRPGEKFALCAPGKAAQRALNGNDCAAAKVAIRELRSAFDEVEIDAADFDPLDRAVQTLEWRRDRHCP
jgi:hypothetical protein